MTPNSSPRPDRGIEEAARWRERLHDDDSPATQADFQAWLDADPSHRSAFARVDATRRTVEALTETPALNRMRAETLARLKVRRAHRFWANRTAIAGIAALFLIVIIGVGVLRPFTLHPPLSGGAQAPNVRTAEAGTFYETQVGQRLVVTLDDASVLTLDTASRVSVNYTPSQRSIRLYGGQAFFKVAHNPNRPFVVTAGDARVIALGTEFDVRLRNNNHLAVTLVTGRVRVERATSAPVASAPAIAILDPGQQVLVRDEARPILASVDVNRETAWRRGQIVFDNQSLGEAVVEMNRYSRVQIAVDDPTLQRLPISGSFDTGQSEAFLDALTAYFPVEARTDGGDHILLKWKAGANGHEGEAPAP